jgi:uncharacterized protein
VRRCCQGCEGNPTSLAERLLNVATRKESLAGGSRQAYNPGDFHQAGRGKRAREFPPAGVGMDQVEYEPLYLKGIAYFNDCEFFESHEAWEEIWTEHFGPSRKFYQGLIQAAVALHHFGNGNIRGAKKVYYGARGYLEPYRPHHNGLDLEQFLGQFEKCFAEVVASQEDFPQIEIVPDLIPEIHLDPPAIGAHQ